LSSLGISFVPHVRQKQSSEKAGMLVDLGKAGYYTRAPGILG
jgi:hypothetical protein